MFLSEQTAQHFLKPLSPGLGIWGEGLPHGANKKHKIQNPPDLPRLFLPHQYSGIDMLEICGLWCDKFLF